MPDMSAWLGTSVPDSEWQAGSEQAAFTALMIAQKASTITRKRRGVVDVSYTVRVDGMGAGARDVMGGEINPGTTRALVLGYKDHPTEDDTDLRRGDRFLLDGVDYEVVMVLPSTPYQLQAIVEAVER